MSYGELKNSPTGSSAIHATNKGGNGAVASKSTSSGSISRRGGERALSTPITGARTPSPQPTRLDATPQSSTIQGSSSLVVPPTLSVISPTPEPSPVSPQRRTHSKSLPTSSVLRTPLTPPPIEKSHSSGSGKRKADEAGVGGDKTPPKDQKESRTTFAPDPRTHRVSVNSGGSSSHAPSSYNRSKRVRLAGSTEGKESIRSVSRNGSLPTPEGSPPNAKTTGSWSSKGSHHPMSTSSHAYGGPPVARSASRSMSYSAGQQRERPPSRRSLSQASIPLSALISPHAPSVSPSGVFHMRDPRKPSPVQRTPWTLSFPSKVQEDEPRWAWRGWVERGGSPLHAWLFFIGFILFPLWWAAALFIPIPATRSLGGSDAEKAVMLDDPQVEHDARSWRTRCRFMAVVSLFTYVPFIVLVGIFA
ncbi:hypothetical protein CPC08DRAFT_624940 [Agrocybe pediades]|nr:hypothetical protein CPC08DRAFT_624940 [Agrocybe pediades]